MKDCPGGERCVASAGGIRSGILSVLRDGLSALGKYLAKPNSSRLPFFFLSFFFLKIFCSRGLVFRALHNKHLPRTKKNTTCTRRGLKKTALHIIAACLADNTNHSGVNHRYHRALAKTPATTSIKQSLSSAHNFCTYVNRRITFQSKIPGFRKPPDTLRYPEKSRD